MLYWQGICGILHHEHDMQQQPESWLSLCTLHIPPADGSPSTTDTIESYRNVALMNVTVHHLAAVMLKYAYNANNAKYRLMKITVRFHIINNANNAYTD